MKEFILAFSLCIFLTGCNMPTMPANNGENLSSNQQIQTESNMEMMLNVGLPTKKLAISSERGVHNFEVEIADTFKQREIGLMNRTELAERSGMLFIFEQTSEQAFWMKNTLIPLDIVFIDENRRVANIAREAQPCQEEHCPLYASGVEIRYVLELKGGATDKLGIKEGDQVTWL
ncbi:MAG: DUF192 domain-containing protein [Candidatus Altimarinota bacterium]